jgi:beta-hydroxylase
MAPINGFIYLFSRVPTTAYLGVDLFPELTTLNANWRIIRDEAVRLHEAGHIKASDAYDDAGFNSFFRTGWRRFYLKWYDDSHPSAAELCPTTVALLREIPTVKAAMFAALAPGSRLVLLAGVIICALAYWLVGCVHDR